MGKSNILVITAVVLTLAIFGIMWFEYNRPNTENTNSVVNNKYKNMPNGGFTLKSQVFENGGYIPAKYTCDGAPPAGGINPPLLITNTPKEAKSLVLIMDDPDVPKQLIPEGIFDHWVIYDIDPLTSSISEGQVFGKMGINSRRDDKYTGPCPPSQYEPTTHRYFFKLYAVDFSIMPVFETPPSKNQILKFIEGHIIAQAELVGKYEKRK